MRKDTKLRVRLTSEEKRRFARAAKREGLSLSAWIRSRLLAEVRRGA